VNVARIATIAFTIYFIFFPCCYGWDYLKSLSRASAAHIGCGSR
jgi:hypothetical protein